MPGKVIGTEFTHGFPGQLSRSIDEIIEAFPNASDDSIAFGTPVVLDSDKSGVVPFTASSKAADVIGFAVRIAKTNETYGKDDACYMPGETVSVLKRGAMTVSVKAGTPAKGNAVYVRNAAGTGKAVGDIVAAAESTGGESSTATTVELTGVVFGGPKDADGNAEIILLTRKL